MSFNAKKFAEITGLNFNKKQYSVTGQLHGMSVFVNAIPGQNVIPIGVFMSVKGGTDSDNITINENLKEFRKTHKTILQSVGYKQYAIVLGLNATVMGKLEEKTADMLRDLSQFCTENGLTPCCEKCGEDKPIDYYKVNNEPNGLCQTCMSTLVSELEMNKAERAEVVPNPINGFGGILVGALASFLLTWIIFEGGYVFPLGGAVGVWLAMFLYNKWGNKITHVSAVVAIIVCLSTAIFASLFCYAKNISEIYKEYNADYYEFYEATLNEIEYLETGNADDLAYYISVYPEFEGYSKGQILEYLREDAEFCELQFTFESIWTCLTNIGEAAEGIVYEGTHSYDSERAASSVIIEFVIWNLVGVLIGGIACFKYFVDLGAGRYSLVKIEE